MSQFGLAEIEKMRAMLQSERHLMFHRQMPILTPANIEQLGSLSNTHTVRVDSDGVVTIDGEVVGYASEGFMIPIENTYAGASMRVMYKSNPVNWVGPLHSNRNKRIQTKEHKRARKRIAAASRKRNRK
jgi:hypothetical protein